MDGEEGDFCVGEGFESIDGVVLGELLGESGGIRLISGGGACDSGVAGHVGHRIDASPRGNLFGVVGGPSEGHETAATSCEQDWFCRIAALLGEFLVKGRVKQSALGISVGFAHIDAGDGDPGVEEALEHPLLRCTGKSVERRRIEHPRFGAVGWRIRRRDEEGLFAGHGEGFAGEGQTAFLRDGLRQTRCGAAE